MTALVKQALRGSRRPGAVGVACIALAVLFPLGTAGRVPDARADQQPSLDAPCPNGRQLNIVAHQDDDLHFIDPFTIRAVRAQKCVRTIYLTERMGETARLFRRESSVRSAYARMAEKPDIWTLETKGYRGKTVQFPRSMGTRRSRSSSSASPSRCAQGLLDGRLPHEPLGFWWVLEDH